MFAMQCKSSSNKIEELELLLQDINLDITEHQKRAHKKWTGYHKQITGIGKYKLFRKARDGIDIKVCVNNIQVEYENFIVQVSSHLN